MDWSKLPDIIAVGLLALAFASVARRSHTRTAGLWLIGWLLILLHFASFLFLPAPQWWGRAADLLGTTCLVWAGILFMWTAVPYRGEKSSRWMLFVLVSVNLLYLCAVSFATSAWILSSAACLLAAGPLGVALRTAGTFQHPLRWSLVALSTALAAFLVAIQSRPNGADLATNAVLFTVYLGCCIHFWWTYRGATTGAFITISGFFMWAMVFAAGPMMAFFPAVHIEREVWNLPKFVVGIGMILLLLEEQIEFNKHLALHDDLTGLPNRRLFQDRLASALERARRTGTHIALLVFDLDRFKQINDTMGHHVGDLLLQHVASVFRARVRRSDTVARTGGDEFSVILEAAANTADAEAVGRSLQALLNEPVSLEQNTLTASASFGIAIFPDDAQDMDGLCIAADLRMYENKRSNDIADSQHDVPRHRSSARNAKKREKNGQDWNR